MLFDQRIQQSFKPGQLFGLLKDDSRQRSAVDGAVIKPDAGTPPIRESFSHGRLGEHRMRESVRINDRRTKRFKLSSYL
jgi:hypothetical protein